MIPKRLVSILPALLHARVISVGLETEFHAVITMSVPLAHIAVISISQVAWTLPGRFPALAIAVLRGMVLSVGTLTNVPFRPITATQMLCVPIPVVLFLAYAISGIMETGCRAATMMSAPLKRIIVIRLPPAVTRRDHISALVIWAT